MNDVFPVVLSLSFSGGFLALILFAVGAVLKNRLSNTWQYYIWLVVVLRLLLPVTPQLDIAGGGSRRPPERNGYAREAGSAADPAQSGLSPEIAMETAPSSSSENPSHQAIAGEQPPTASFDWRPVLRHAWIPWLGAAVVLFGLKVAVYLRFGGVVRTGGREIADGPLHSLFQDELAQRGIRRRIPLYLNDKVGSPMLLGIFRPAVVVPALEISEDGFRHIVRHELTHYKRRDYLYKWLVQLALCLHWFNPLVHLAAKRISRSCELSCDEAVVKTLDEQGRAAYGDALMACLRSRGKGGSRAVALTMSEDAAAIKDRLEAIMSYRRKSWLSRIAALALTFALCCGFLAVGAYAAEKPGNPAQAQQRTDAASGPIVPVQAEARQMDPLAAYPPRDHGWSHISTLYQDGYYIVAGWRTADTLQRYAWSTAVEIDGRQHRVALWDEISSYGNDERAMRLVGRLVANIIRESDPGRAWEGSFWVVRDIFHQVPADEIMTAAYQQENLIGFYGILDYVGDAAKERQLEAAYNDRRESYVSALCNHMPDTYNGEELARRAAQEGERTMFDSISKYVSMERRTELRETLDAAERRASGPADAASDYSVLRYGPVDVRSGSAVEMNITWGGEGQVLALYTKADFTEEELRHMVEAQILPFKTNDYRGTDHSLTSAYNHGVEETMYLAMNGNQRLERSLTAAETARYYLYVIASKDAGSVRGVVDFGGYPVTVSSAAQ